MTRERVIPPGDRTIHLIGDIHIGATTGFQSLRYPIVVADLAESGRTLPTPAARLQLGDVTQSGTTAHAAAAVAWLDALPGADSWNAVIGNHDLWDGKYGDEIADELGLPAANYTIDLGFCVIVVLGPVGTDTADRTTVVIEAATLEWLDTTLAGLADRSVLLACHPPLYNTSTGPAGTTNRSIDTGFFVVAPEYASRGNGVRDTPIREVLDDHPCVRAWIAGHTHTGFVGTTVTGLVDIGSREIAYIDTSCIFFVGKDYTYPRFHPLRTSYLTVYDDRLELRWRNHGSRSWEGPNGQRVTVLAA